MGTEQKLDFWLCITGVKRSRRTDALKGFHKDDKDEAECAICHLYLHVSGLECDCCPGRRVCLHHADNLCECDPTGGASSTDTPWKIWTVFCSKSAPTSQVKVGSELFELISSPCQSSLTAVCSKSVGNMR